MKTILLLFVAVLFLLISSFSQITITSSNIVDIGDVVALANDTIPDASITPGSSGANQTWDFSALAIHTQDSMLFVDPAMSPYDTSFTGDNIAAFFTDMNVWAYFNRTSSILENMGMVGDIFGNGSIFEIEFNPTETLMQFPFTYMDSYNDNSFMEVIIDTLKMEQTVTKTVVADAWGTITTPYGSYNSIRIRTYKIEAQEIFKDVLGFWVPIHSQADTTVSYEWWSDDSALRFPLVSFKWDTVASVVDDEVEWLQNTFTLNRNALEDNNVEIYPNPCKDLLNIVAEKINRIEIVNMNGEIVLNSKTTLHEVSINTKNLPRGLYLVKVYTDEGLIVRKQIVN